MFTITREMGFDYGHRVMTHQSRCKNVHGHRGTIEATCEGASLHESGEQTDMILDFGFLKEVLMAVVDESIDHGFIGFIGDDVVMEMFSPYKAADAQKQWEEALLLSMGDKGFHLTTDTRGGSKLYVVDFIPTSERLAEHFFKRLQKPIEERSLGKAKLTNLRFWETPNCYSDFPGFTAGKSSHG